MTVQIGNIVLDDNLRLHGIETAKDIAVEQIGVLDGSSVFQTMPISGGRSLSLVATKEGNTLKGKILRSQLMAIKSLAAGGQPVTLVHHLGTFSVLIISTEDVIPVFDKADPQADAPYTGTITMIEV
ncbi:MAG: hypothetical protein KKI15_07575 [Proteobacteria bacterium]|nr:hypothetical protein [Pseudomonadota bacterium]